MKDCLENILNKKESKSLIDKAKGWALHHIHLTSTIFSSCVAGATYGVMAYIGAVSHVNSLSGVFALGSFAVIDSYLTIQYFRKSVDIKTKHTSPISKRSKEDILADLLFGYSAVKSVVLAAYKSYPAFKLAAIKYDVLLRTPKALPALGVIASLNFIHYYSCLKPLEIAAHPKNMRIYTSLFKLGCHFFDKNKDTFLELCEQYFEKYGSAFYLSSAGEYCLRNKNIDKAMLYFMRANSSFNLQKNKSQISLFEQYLHGRVIYRYDNKNIKQIEEYLSLATIISRWNPAKTGIMLCNISQAESRYRTYLNALYAFFLEQHKPNQAFCQWNQTINLALSDPKTEYLPIGESKNLVRVIAGEFMGSAFVIKTSQNRIALEQELQLNSMLASLIKNHPCYNAAKPVSIVEDGSQYHYVMRRDCGKTMFQLLNEGETAKIPLDKIVDYLALQHAGLQADGQPKNIRIAHNLKTKLCTKSIPVSHDLAISIVHNYRPVYESLKKCNFACSRDAHPENWLIGEDDKILSLDCEVRPDAPLQFDLVSLLEYGKYFTDFQKDSIIQKYILSYNKYPGVSKITDYNDFHLGYLNSVIHRSIALCSAWSSPERTSLHSKRTIIIENALHAISRIEKEHIDFYQQWHVQYTGLRNCLNKILPAFSKYAPNG